MEINLQELGEANLGLLTDECLTSYRKGLATRLDEILDTADQEQNGSLTDEQRETFDALELREKEVSAELERRAADAERRSRQQARNEKLKESAGRRAPPSTAVAPDQVDGVEEEQTIAARQPVNPDDHSLGQPQSDPAPGFVRMGHHDQRGIAISRMIRAVAASKGDLDRGIRFARDTLGDERVALAMEAGDFETGGFVVPSNYVPELIELLRPRSVVRRMGPSEAPLVNGSLTLPKLTGGATANYIGESTNIPPSQLTGGQVKATARKLVSLVPVSNDLLRFASPSADTMVRNDLLRAMAQAEDAAFIRSDGGGNAPKGLRYWAASSNVIAANGTINLQNVDLDLGKLLLALMDSNVMLDNPGWLFSPRTWNYLTTLRDGNGNKAFPEMERGLLKGYPYSSTTQIPVNLGSGSDESEIYFVNFADVVIAEDPRFELEASSVAAYHDGSNVQAAFSLDQTVVRVIANHDLIMRHNEAAAVLTGVKWGA